MSARSLQDDLLSIPGVEGADVEGSEDRPAGLRIRIAEGADQGAVGGAIRRVLNAHGLGTDTRLPGEDDTEADVGTADDLQGAASEGEPVAAAGEEAAEAAAAVAVLDDVADVVVRATAALARPGAPQARVVEIDDRRIEGVDIVMIVLELDGELATGSSVVRAGRAYALGRATWAALTT